MSIFSDRMKNARIRKAAAVIVAAGSGTRFGADKMTAQMMGTPVLAHTLLAFERAEVISDIVLVVRGDYIQAAGALCREYGIGKLHLIVPGGSSRLLSSFAGVMAVESDTSVIAIHDGARPLVTEKIIKDAVWGAYLHGAAVPGIPVKDTIKQAESSVVTDTPERRKLFAVQTPQCFRADVIRAALADAVKNAPDVTDDCMAVERLGGRIFLTEGSEENLKITTPLDMAVAELIMTKRIYR